MKKYVAEFIGTFFLVFIIVGSVSSAGAYAPIAIGLGLTALVYAGGHISGAQYNPAVSLAVWMVGGIDAARFGGFALVQILAAFIGACTAQIVTGNADVTGMGPAVGASTMSSLIAETLGTFMLVYVILNVTLTPAYANNSFFGLSIGFTITAMAFAFGAVSGGAFNPAVGIGRALADLLLNEGRFFNFTWIYIMGPCIGGALAALVYNYFLKEVKS